MSNHTPIMANRKDDGFLPGYASHLSRYCTTCRDEIRFQVITKAKRCSNGHRVDLRDETDLDLGRCCYCDNLIRGKNYLLLAFHKAIVPRKFHCADDCF